MPKFKKKILPEGQYLVIGKDQERKLVSFDKEKLNTISKNTQSMIDSGLKIPAPFQHLKEAVPVTEVPINSSYDNAGYWDKVWTEEQDGITFLWAEVDAPGEETDFNSPAGKIQNTIKEVSACISDEWIDGVGRKWGPCMTHGALVVHPVVPGQDNFSVIDNSVALSISGIVSEVNPGDMSELSKALADSVKVFLSPDTLLTDLPKALMVALRQYKLCIDSTDEDSEVVQTQPIFMSLTDVKEMPLTKKEAENLLALGAINPKTNKAFVFEDFEIKEDPRDKLNLSLVSNIAETQKESLRRRAEQLVKDGRMQKEYAEAKVYPQIDKIDLSLVSFDNDNKLNPMPVETVIESLEALPVPSGKEGDDSKLNFALGDEIVTPPHSKEKDQLSGDQQNALIQELLAQM